MDIAGLARWAGALSPNECRAGSDAFLQSNQLQSPFGRRCLKALEEALNFFSERDVIYEAVPVKKATHLCPASRVPCPAPSKIRDLASALSERAWAARCTPRCLRGHLLSTIDSRSHLSQRRP